MGCDGSALLAGILFLRKSLILRVKNNMTLEMLENGGCKLGKGKRQVEVRR
jgi:hypothetical protein